MNPIFINTYIDRLLGRLHLHCTNLVMESELVNRIDEMPISKDDTADDIADDTVSTVVSFASDETLGEDDGRVGEDSTTSKSITERSKEMYQSQMRWMTTVNGMATIVATNQEVGKSNTERTTTTIGSMLVLAETIHEAALK